MHSLWSRLILHFWALEAERDSSVNLEAISSVEPDPVKYLQRAYEYTKEATSSPNEWKGTTTACAALLHYDTQSISPKPMLYVTNLGDSQVMVVRPKAKKLVYKTTEQWHWFDCPRQLGTNSPDTPATDAVMDKLEIEEDDIVLAMSDGVVDNLWEHEVIQSVHDSVQRWDSDKKDSVLKHRPKASGKEMLAVAKGIVKAAKTIAEDPYAESPFMERAVEEGLAMEGVITQCSIRHLYTLPIPQLEKDPLILTAKNMERRRCNHHTLDDPLSTLECLASVIDPKGSSTNKHRYVVASQEEGVRRYCRGVKGVPLVYVKRSVMVLEPMAEGSLEVREASERGKFKTGLRGKAVGAGNKRKRDGGAEGDLEQRDGNGIAGNDIEREQRPKKKIRGPKGPNPLSVKKSKKTKEVNMDPSTPPVAERLAVKVDPVSNRDMEGRVHIVEGPLDESRDSSSKRKRKRKHRPGALDEFRRTLDAASPPIE
ncbi:MAG: hypothetical protein LQ342_002578 [Letrouitia transgressa]|nr:MAG: hypothetical protein LQ342_002578 [Letrouitia transgressa]